MKTLTITVSDEFAANVEEVARIFEYPDFGHTLERVTDWHFDEVLDPERLISDMEDVSWDEEDECRRVSERIIEKQDDEWTFQVRQRKDGRWVSGFLPARKAIAA